MKSPIFLRYFVALVLLLFSLNASSESLGELSAVWQTKPYLPEEQWNLDSLAYWDDGEGGGLLFVSAKEGNSIMVLDPFNGELITKWGRTDGKPGSEPGEFSRPNGLLVWRDYLFVVERDNRRVQALALPSGKPLATFGDDILLKPYGICAVDIYPSDLVAEDGVSTVDAVGLFVTDDYQPNTEATDPDELPLEALRAIAGARVKVFAFAVTRDENGDIKETIAETGSARWFGDTVGQGVLYVVESIVFDAANGQEILICDELQKNVKVYTSLGGDGGYVQKVAFHRLLNTPVPLTGDPEGIALWDLEGQPGYVVLTEQEKKLTTFHLWERGYPNPYRGNFTVMLPGVSQTERDAAHEQAGSAPPIYLANTDGIALVSGDVGVSEDGTPLFPGGAIFAIHDDASVAGFALGDLAARLTPAEPAASESENNTENK